jgi:rhodanese-related sulfurtransferase
MIPEYEIADRAEKELPNKDQLILVYCRSGRRSKIAAQELVKLGYTNVKEFGGIIDWEYEIVK